jgi:hypothetical protein
MCIDTNGTSEQLKNRGLSVYQNMSFEDVIQHDIDHLNSLGITVSQNHLHCHYEFTYRYDK